MEFRFSSPLWNTSAKLGNPCSDTSSELRITPKSTRPCRLLGRSGGPGGQADLRLLMLVGGLQVEGLRPVGAPPCRSPLEVSSLVALLCSIAQPTCDRPSVHLAAGASARSQQGHRITAPVVIQRRAMVSVECRPARLTWSMRLGSARKRAQEQRRGWTCRHGLKWRIEPGSWRLLATLPIGLSPSEGRLR